MKRRTFFWFPVLTILAVLFFPALALADNYTIISEADMIDLKNDVNGGNTYLGDTFELMNDITLSGNWQPIGNGHDFEGTFDGNGYRIEYSAINFNSSGLFLEIGFNGTVKNLHVKASVTSTSQGDYAGGITCFNYGNITNCSIEGSVTNAAGYGGGLTGANSGTISNCFNKGSVNAFVAGGLAGTSPGSNFVNCYNVGAVTGTNAGGLLGGASDTAIIHSFWLDTLNAVGFLHSGNNIQDCERFYDSGDLYAPVLGQITLLDALNDHTDIWAIYSNGYNYPVFRTISVSPASLDFGSVETGYDAPLPQMVTIENDSEYSVSLSALPAPTDFTLGPLTQTDLQAGGTATFTVQPKTGLLPGTHGDTLAISDTAGNAVNVSVTFTVTPYMITAAPASLAFDSLAAGYLQPDSQTVTVTNNGSKSISLYQPTAAHYVIGTLSDTALAPGDTATFTMVPKAGLTVGTYNETVQILGSFGANTTVEAAFTCTDPVDYYIISGDGSVFQQGDPDPSSLTIIASGSMEDFTGLTLNGQLVDESNYDVSEGSTIVTLHQDFLNSLEPGTYTLRFHYTDGQAQASFVVQDYMPPTGDSDAVYVFGALTVLCLAAIWLIKKYGVAKGSKCP